MRARHIACKRAVKTGGRCRLGRKQRVGRGSQALIGRDELEATTAAVAEPDPQAHILMIQGTRSERCHVGERRVAEQNRIKPLGHQKRHMRSWLRAGTAAAVVAPIGGRPVGVDQGKLELAVAIKVHSIHRHAALVVEPLRHGGLGGPEAEGDEPKEKSSPYEMLQCFNHGLGVGGGVDGKRPGAGADDGGACLAGSGAPGRKPSPESVA